MKNLHIENSYNTWSTGSMHEQIVKACRKRYFSSHADIVLNRTYRGMYIEWYLHNIGYYITLPFIKNEKMRSINERCKHVDLEEHKSQ